MDIKKASLISIASIFTAVGAANLAKDDLTSGVIFLLIAVALLVLREYLKKTGIEIESKK